MKIGFFTDSYLPQLDGVATSVTACAEELERRGHKVSIIAPKKPGYKDKKKNVIRLRSVKVHSEPEFRMALQIPETSLLRALRIDYDIIHGHSGGPVTFLGWQIAKVKGVPYVVTYHTLWNRYTHYFLKGKVLRPRLFEVFSRVFGNVSNGIFAPTVRVKEELLSYGVKKPIYVLPSGIDTAKFKNAKRGYLRKQLKLSKKQKVLLYVGRLGKEKSVEFLVRAFQIIHAEDPETVLVLVGDGGEKKRLLQLVTKLNLDGAVVFYGSVQHADIPRFYKDADIFVFASQTETQGMVIHEAFASGIPVVAVKDSAFSGVVVDHKNGFLVRKNLKEFADRVLLILSDSDMRSEFGRNALITAERFSLKAIVDELERRYKEVLAKSHSEKNHDSEAISLH